MQSFDLDGVLWWSVHSPLGTVLFKGRMVSHITVLKHCVVKDLKDLKKLS